MKLLGRKNDDGDAKDVDSTLDVAETTDELSAPGTAPKGRPTPKRDAAKRRGPVAPAPMTSKEARARRKAMAGPKLSKEERKIERAERRAITGERRERMMAGDEAYLLPRDQGPVRRYARDIVDARRNLLGLFMPAALFLIFVMLAVPQLGNSGIISIAMLALIAIMAIDGIFLARLVNNSVDVKFPDNTEGRFKLGFYAAGRASQLRRMRAPRPNVNRGDKVA